MIFWLKFFAVYLPLFFVAYLCMLWREKVCDVHYGPTEFNTSIFLALFIPPLAITFALAEVLGTKMNIRTKEG